jgi:hypothetical protein
VSERRGVWARLAGGLGERARSHMPPVLAEAIDHSHALDAAEDPEVRKVEAEKAFNAFERFCGERSPDDVVSPGSRSCWEGRRAQAALESGRLEDAEQLGRTAIERISSSVAGQPGGSRKLAPTVGPEWMLSEQVLGRLALGRGDVQEAEVRLLASFEQTYFVPPGPRFELAMELAEQGRTESVIRYLELCRHVMWPGRARLTDWEGMIRVGIVPQGWRRYPVE